MHQLVILFLHRCVAGRRAPQFHAASIAEADFAEASCTQSAAPFIQGSITRKQNKEHQINHMLDLSEVACADTAGKRSLSAPARICKHGRGGKRKSSTSTFTEKLVRSCLSHNCHQGFAVTRQRRLQRHEWDLAT